MAFETQGLKRDTIVAMPLSMTAQRKLDLENSTIEEIERPCAGRIPNAKTIAAMAEDTRKARRYKSAAQMLKALNNLKSRGYQPRE